MCVCVCVYSCKGFSVFFHLHFIPLFIFILYIFYTIFSFLSSAFFAPFLHFIAYFSILLHLIFFLYNLCLTFQYFFHILGDYQQLLVAFLVSTSIDTLKKMSGIKGLILTWHPLICPCFFCFICYLWYLCICDIRF